MILVADASALIALAASSQTGRVADYRFFT